MCLWEKLGDESWSSGSWQPCVTWRAWAGRGSSMAGMGRRPQSQGGVGMWACFSEAGDVTGVVERSGSMRGQKQQTTGWRGSA